MAKDVDGRLDEYKTLRAEILQTQQLRTSIMQWTTAAMAVLIGFALKSFTETGSTRGPAVALAVLGAHVFLLSAILLSRRHAIHANRIGRYIEYYLETSDGRVPGLNWERRWNEFRKKGKAFQGASRTEGVYYAIVAVAVFALNFIVACDAKVGIIRSVDLVLALFCIGVCVETYRKSSQSWHPDWTSIK